MSAAMSRDQGQDDSTIVVLPFAVTAGSVELPLFMNVQKVAKVVELTRLSPLPDAYRPFIGLHDEGGVAIPVIDLGAELAKGSPTQKSERPQALAMGDGQSALSSHAAFSHGPRRLLICEVIDLWVGLVVEKTRKVRRQSNAAIIAPPRALASHELRFTSGMLREDGGFRYMLDLEGLLVAMGVSIATLEEKSPAAAEKPRALQGVRLLLVEDSALFQALGRNLFTREGAEVTIAADGEKGLERLLAKDANYDLVIADIEMPLMNGIEMVRHYRQKVTQPAPVLFHSAITNPILAADIQREGLGDYVPKFEEHTILAKVAAMVEGKRSRTKAS